LAFFFLAPSSDLFILATDRANRRPQALQRLLVPDGPLRHSGLSLRPQLSQARDLVEAGLNDKVEVRLLSVSAGLLGVLGMVGLNG
jgi:hypothetical protein